MPSRVSDRIDINVVPKFTTLKAFWIRCKCLYCKAPTTAPAQWVRFSRGQAPSATWPRSRLRLWRESLLSHPKLDCQVKTEGMVCAVCKARPARWEVDMNEAKSEFDDRWGPRPWETVAAG